MRDSYLDELDDILTQRSGFDDSFRNEISYYNSIPEISVDPQILSLYDRKTNVASNAERIINADTKSIKSIKRGIEETEMHLKNDRINLVEMVQQIRDAKKEWKSTIPFTKKAREAHRKFVHLKRQLKERNRAKRRGKERLREDKERITNKQAEIDKQTKALKEAKDYSKKLETGIRRQFEVVNRILAIREHIGTMDLYDPNLPREYSTALTRFSQLTKQPLKISISTPLTDQSTELMQVLNRLQSVTPDIDKLAIKQAEQTIDQRRKNYIKRLEDPSLDALDVPEVHGGR